MPFYIINLFCGYRELSLKGGVVEYEYAKVIVRSVDDYSATFTLNKGTNDGIKENMVVIKI